MARSRFMYKIIKIIINPVIKIFFPYEVTGKENLKNINGGYILCSNHLSNLDPFFLILSHDRQICFMAKAELFRNFILKFFLEKLGAFPIKRGKGDKKALCVAEDILKNSEILGIFIEGTRSKTGEFLSPKSGVSLLAYKSKVSVVPVCITGGGENNKVRLFKKSKISYGKMIDITDIPGAVGVNASTLRKISNDIMDKIKEMRK